ncbi:MAG: tRNA (adenosine(37)-N6)-threonylcarbamoyltransferase complex ATPase subunit type 1 TsaE [Blautia sp.]|nr:tRNA (adenosine(37)-N6)-threonylcarbamoyltransferase complex ATPase subunit type 1 TsaE [Blautia sp.]
MKTVESFCAGDTFALGEEMGKKAVPGQVIALTGDLGVGKTVFTKGFAKGLGVKEDVNSPTFTILQEYYGGRLPFYHFDVYRILDVFDMEEIGYEDYFYGEGVCLVEWGEVVKSLLPEHVIWVRLTKDPAKGFDYRKIVIEGGEES